MKIEKRNEKRQKTENIYKIQVEHPLVVKNTFQAEDT